jgi:arylsulfatase A-like enzyme
MPSKHRAGGTISGEAIDASGRVIGEKRTFSGLDAGIPTIAELLGDRGYETAAVANNVYLHPAFGVARGFQDYDYTPGSEDDFRPANRIVDRAIGWLDTHGQKPFFLLVHLMDPHMNYNAPPPFRGRFSGAYESRFTLPVTQTKQIREEAASMPEQDRVFIGAAYDEEVAFVDEQVGRLLDQLEKRGLLRNAVVVLTSDHGEELFDHGGFTHGHTMYEELLHVPLVVWAPGARPQRVTIPVSLVDVMPTVLEATGVAAPRDLAGVSLWPAIARQTAIEARVLGAEYTCIGPERKAILDWPYKLVFTDDGSPPRLVDLATDPGEKTDLSDARPEVRKRLLAQLKQIFPPGTEAREGQAVELDELTRERLRSLGYLD